MMKRRNLFAELIEGMNHLARERENRHIGSNFDDFLIEEGRLEESTEAAKKKIKQIGREPKSK